MEAVNLCVAFVGGTVLPLDLEKEVLHFPQRTVLYGGGDFFYNARELWLRLSSRREMNCALRFVARYWRFSAMDASRLRMAR
jgi:hypothetical protein